MGAAADAEDHETAMHDMLEVGDIGSIRHVTVHGAAATVRITCWWSCTCWPQAYPPHAQASKCTQYCDMRNMRGNVHSRGDNVDRAALHVLQRSNDAW